MGDSRVAEYAIGLLPYKTKNTPPTCDREDQAKPRQKHMDNYSSLPIKPASRLSTMVEPRGMEMSRPRSLI
jgi:hypothetical protein